MATLAIGNKTASSLDLPEVIDSFAKTKARAAFEAVSNIILRPHERLSFIDVRKCHLPPETPPYDDFDPRDYRQPRAPIHAWMAYFNLLRSGFGAGMVGMPLAISQIGIVMGPILSLCIGILIIHTHLTLLWCLNEVSRQLKIPYISYRYGFRLALLRGPKVFHWLGRIGPALIAIFMMLSQLGICTVFVIFTTDSLRDIMDWQDSKTAVYALLVPYMILEMMMKNLKIVSYISLLGNFMNVCGLLLVFYHIFRDPEKSDEIVETTTSVLHFLFATGNMMFNMSAVGVVLSLDKALENPRVMTSRTGVVVVGISAIAIVGTIVGTLGYWAFGTMEENILRSLPFDDDTSMASMGLYLLAVAFAYPIQCYPVIQIIIEIIKNQNPTHAPSINTLKTVEYITRPVFVLTTFHICYFIPFQGPFVAFVGNLCTSVLALVFPAMMELCLLYPNRYGRYYIYLIKDILILLTGLISWIFGAGLSGYLIYIRYLSLKSPNAGL